jgi:hypothetical protein
LLEQQKADERFRFAMLKKLAAEAFDAIDRGEHVTVAAEKLEEFLESLKGEAC